MKHIRYGLLVFMIISFSFGRSIVDNHLALLVVIGMLSSFIGTLAGGGGLITVPAMMLTGIPIQTSIATNKFSSGIAAMSSVFYLVNRRQLTIQAIVKTVATAFVGGIAGALLTAYISEKTMNVVAFVLLFFALIVTVGSKNWAKGRKGEEVTLSPQSWRPWTPLFIAAYDGGFGPGSSTFGILYYMKKHHTYLKAVQLTRVLILGSCVGGFLVFYQTGFFQWPYAVALAIGSTVGSQVGLLVLPKVPMKLAKGLLLTVTCLLILSIVYKLV
ncbi:MULTISPECIES: sulfite exporter TauE/SafE family protein [Shouchella]|uniref:sulfite exporter TauE/SafE family protein n=1 Tax=Shouchella TaxID=2893057 RepID=UPI0009212C32|nr:TSUP family transporter [Shouchella clausii]SHL35410.1 hypothetical protein SAMN05192535_1984 [Shouchella rhizosphaerae]